MRTVHYSDILRGTASLAGMVYAPGETTSDVDLPVFRLFRTFHDRRLQVAWEIHRWPELCRIEKRTYREAWNVSATYAATDERYDAASGKYFQALRASTGQAPTAAGVENAAYWAECKNGYSASDWITGTAYAVGDQVRNSLTGLYYQCYTAHTAGATFAGDLATKWGLLTPFDRYIAYEQTGETAIGEYIQITNNDPRITTQVSAYPFWLSEQGAQVGVLAPNAVWLYYRTRRAELRGDVWEADTTYADTDQVYFVSGGVGDFYTANQATTAGQSPATHAAKWDVVEIPYFMRGYLIEGGFADWLTAEARAEEAGGHEQLATQFLELEADKLQRQQQQVRRMQVAVGV